MSIFHAMDISSSALTANRLRMDVVSSNIANVNSTRSRLIDGEWQPYRRKMVELTPSNNQSFRSFLHKASGRQTEGVGGVVASNITEDRTPFKLMYDPEHPDANEDGYVQLPNVDMVKEMTDLTSATRSYEANVTSLNAAKSMYLKALEIGK